MRFSHSLLGLSLCNSGKLDTGLFLYTFLLGKSASYTPENMAINLEMIQSIQEDDCNFNANTKPPYIMNLASTDYGIYMGLGLLQIMKAGCIVM